MVPGFVLENPCERIWSIKSWKKATRISFSSSASSNCLMPEPKAFARESSTSLPGVIILQFCLNLSSATMPSGLGIAMVSHSCQDKSPPPVV